MKRLRCGRRKLTAPQPMQAEAIRAEGVSSDVSRVVVSCRGTHFETVNAMLSRLGPCYLTNQLSIDTGEDIRLDCSPAAFHVLLDALGMAQLDLRKAIMHILRSRSGVPDLEAFLHFILLDWVLGVNLPLPPQPSAGMPCGDSWKSLGGHGRYYGRFELGTAYHFEAGVFHHMIGDAALSMPCSYTEYEEPNIPLRRGEEYMQIMTSPTEGCIPVSLEMGTSLLDNESDDVHEWIGDVGVLSTSSSIHMLGPTSLHKQGYIKMHAGSALVFDLGPRRALRCEGLVVGVARTAKNRPGHHHDILIVDVASDLDESGSTTKILCHPLHLQGRLITYFHLPIAPEAQRLGRMFRFTLHPFQPDASNYWHFGEHPLYEFHLAELFGDFLELPLVVVPDEHVRNPFVMNPDVVRLKSRQFAA